MRRVQTKSRGRARTGCVYVHGDGDGERNSTRTRGATEAAEHLDHANQELADCSYSSEVMLLRMRMTSTKVAVSVALPRAIS